MRRGRVLFCIFLIIVAAHAIRSALQWNFKAALFPLAVSTPLLILTAIELFRVITAKTETDQVPSVDLDFSSDVSPEVASCRVAIGFSWIVGFIAAVYLIGFPLTVPVFIFFYLRFQGGVTWVGAIAVTAITWAGFYLVFQRLVHIPFEPGALEVWFRP
jgi:Tripartite tricarboxylate transporter TctB family